MPTSPMEDATNHPSLSNPEGFAVIRDGMQSLVGYDPHDYQIEAVARVVEGQDVLALLPTGAGKTGIFVMAIHALIKMNTDPTWARSYSAISSRIPDSPAMIAIYPTNTLAEEQGDVFRRAGLDTVVINANTIDQDRRAGSNIWSRAKTASVIVLSPEQLGSPAFEALLQMDEFHERVYLLVVDEVHVLYSWGQSFRVAFKHIGPIRDRFRSRLVMVGTTATLLHGYQTNNIRSFLNLSHNTFVLHRSNIRNDIRQIFRKLTHGIGGSNFSDLRWVVGAMGRKTIVFVSTISIGFRLFSYLQSLLPPQADFRRIIRMYNAVNWPAHNVETQEFFRNDPKCRIIIATDILMVGVDFPNVQDVIVLGEPPDANNYFQKIGRAGRNRKLVPDPRAIIYITKSAEKNAKLVLNPPKPSAATSTDKLPTLDPSMATLILAQCKTKEQNRLYNNPDHDTPCSCKSCHASPPPPSTCRCSGCVEDEEPELLALASEGKLQTRRGPRGINKQERELAIKKLEGFRHRLSHHLNFDGPEKFWILDVDILPDKVVKAIVDNFKSIGSPEDLLPFISNLKYLPIDHHNELISAVYQLREDFVRLRSEAANIKIEVKPEPKTEEWSASHENPLQVVHATPDPNILPPLFHYQRSFGGPGLLPAPIPTQLAPIHYPSTGHGIPLPPYVPALPGQFQDHSHGATRMQITSISGPQVLATSRKRGLSAASSAQGVRPTKVTSYLKAEDAT